jgi:hypothetical protein
MPKDGSLKRFHMRSRPRTDTTVTRLNGMNLSGSCCQFLPRWKLLGRQYSIRSQRSAEQPRTCWISLLQRSRESWLATAKSRNGRWFFDTLKESAYKATVATELCFDVRRSSRRVGLFVFSECDVNTLLSSRVSTVTPRQIELLLLEAQSMTSGFDALARLHACLAPRIDEMNSEIQEFFYDEVARQSLNTHQYRSTLATVALGNEYLTALVADVAERLNEMRCAAASPALQMSAPGQDRAQMLHDRIFARDVAEATKRHSVFLNLVHRVNLLYGGDGWRVFSTEKGISDASKMQSVSNSVEVPRLEVIDPEGVHLRRVSASAKIAQLELNSERESQTL